jgi:hypothetical protein
MLHSRLFQAFCASFSTIPDFLCFILDYSRLSILHSRLFLAFYTSFSIIPGFLYFILDYSRLSILHSRLFPTFYTSFSIIPCFLYLPAFGRALRAFGTLPFHFRPISCLNPIILTLNPPISELILRSTGPQIGPCLPSVPFPTLFGHFWPFPPSDM